MLPPLAISTGDPAGVGPVVTAAALARGLGTDRALVYGDAAWMERALRRYGFEALKRVDAADAQSLGAGEVGLVHVADWPLSMVQARAVTIDGGGVQREALEAACDAAIDGTARAIVTGPVSKEAVSLSGVSFRGQTEHLARRAGVHVDNVTMMFLGPRLKVALVGTHWPIKRVPSTVTREHIERTVRHLTDALSRWLPEVKPLQKRRPRLLPRWTIFEKKRRTRLARWSCWARRRRRPRSAMPPMAGRTGSWRCSTTRPPFRPRFWIGAKL
ncbi:MAG: 4-hydroxythreonine-4-phosphate dehydrogenase PdxA [Deltaproteobacteria bacterium]|nr:4-hydroxythreonine-4-phosphate dehydrogenase PdxA [Deltaproteobacteria bacterium]